MPASRRDEAVVLNKVARKNRTLHNRQQIGERSPRNEGYTVLSNSGRHFNVRRVQKGEHFPMAYKTPVPQIEIRRPPAAEDLRRVFETAVGKVHQDDLAARKEPGYRSPIVQRGRIFEISQAGAEKRALADAAQALALLWKV